MWKTILSLLTIFLPFQFALPLGGYLNVAITRIIIPVLFVVSVLWLVTRRKKLFLRPQPLPLILLSFLLICMFSLVWADEPMWGWRKLLFLFSIVPIYFVIVITKPSAKSIVSALIAAGGITAFVAIVQFSLQHIIGLDPALNVWRALMPFFLGGSFATMVLEYPSWLVNVAGSTLFRAIAFFPDPHSLAFFLEIILFWPLFAFLQYKKKRYLIIFFAVFFALLLTFSRGAYVSIALSLTIFTIWLLLHKQRLDALTRQKVKQIILFAGVLVILLVASFGSVFIDRFSSSFDIREGSNEGRMEMWRAGWDIFQKNPLTGVGLGNFPLEVKPSADYREPIYAHNLYLDVAAEMGMFGLIALLGVLFFTARNFSILSHKNPLYLAGVFSIIVFSIHAFFDTPLFSLHTFTLLCVIMGVSSLRK